jgi:hypothetical protein
MLSHFVAAGNMSSVMKFRFWSCSRLSNFDLLILP